MQEFTWPGRTAETELAFDLEKAALRREFEQCLEECGTLAFRVARGVLRNAADAEDVAQEAMLRSYRQFARLRDRSRFRAWLVRVSFRLALDHGRSTRRREQRETDRIQDLTLGSFINLGFRSNSKPGRGVWQLYGENRCRNSPGPVARRRPS